MKVIGITGPTGAGKTTALNALVSLGGRIIDGGPCALGVESTIVDLTGEEPVILREGAIPAQEILAVLREG